VGEQKIEDLNESKFFFEEKLKKKCRFVLAKKKKKWGLGALSFTIHLYSLSLNN